MYEGGKEQEETGEVEGNTRRQGSPSGAMGDMNKNREATPVSPKNNFKMDHKIRNFKKRKGQKGTKHP